MQKLQLELVPYCSRTFDSFVKGKKQKFFPYLETLLDEIFRVERTYVIFASAKFEELFREYNLTNKTFDLTNKDNAIQLTQKLIGTCKVVKINYKGKTIKALIAKTFPSQALPNAYDLMECYGKFCYNSFINCQ